MKSITLKVNGTPHPVRVEDHDAPARRPARAGGRDQRPRGLRRRCLRSLHGPGRRHERLGVPGQRSPLRQHGADHGGRAADRRRRGRLIRGEQRDAVRLLHPRVRADDQGAARGEPEPSDEQIVDAPRGQHLPVRAPTRSSSGRSGWPRRGAGHEARHARGARWHAWTRAGSTGRLLHPLARPASSGGRWSTSCSPGSGCVAPDARGHGRSDVGRLAVHHRGHGRRRRGADRGGSVRTGTPWCRCPWAAAPRSPSPYAVPMLVHGLVLADTTADYGPDKERPGRSGPARR